MLHRKTYSYDCGYSAPLIFTKQSSFLSKTLCDEAIYLSLCPKHTGATFATLSLPNIKRNENLLLLRLGAVWRNGMGSKNRERGATGIDILADVKGGYYAVQ